MRPKMKDRKKEEPSMGTKISKKWEPKTEEEIVGRLEAVSELIEKHKAAKAQTKQELAKAEKGLLEAERKDNKKVEEIIEESIGTLSSRGLIDATLCLPSPHRQHGHLKASIRRMKESLRIHDREVRSLENEQRSLQNELREIEANKAALEVKKKCDKFKEDYFRAEESYDELNAAVARARELDPGFAGSRLPQQGGHQWHTLFADSHLGRNMQLSVDSISQVYPGMGCDDNPFYEGQ